MGLHFSMKSFLKEQRLSIPLNKIPIFPSYLQRDAYRIPSLLSSGQEATKKTTLINGVTCKYVCMYCNTHIYPGIYVHRYSNYATTAHVINKTVRNHS